MFAVKRQASAAFGEGRLPAFELGCRLFLKVLFVDAAPSLCVVRTSNLQQPLADAEVLNFLNRCRLALHGDEHCRRTTTTSKLDPPSVVCTISSQKAQLLRYSR